MPSVTIEIKNPETKTIFKLAGSDIYLTYFGDGTMGVSGSVGGQRFAAIGKGSFVRADFWNNEENLRIVCRTITK